ncbi:MAG TPA: hypothetical protein VEL11_10845 [Candidatus Bathyarchaeia archaeon]|nr:hypothetical protein [Candidatus Bathyarchaeia archaeon]
MTQLPFWSIETNSYLVDRLRVKDKERLIHTCINIKGNRKEENLKFDGLTIWKSIKINYNTSSISPEETQSFALISM